jgi:hypothetical protein
MRKMLLWSIDLTALCDSDRFSKDFDSEHKLRNSKL